MNDSESPISINRQALNARTDLLSMQFADGAQSTSIVTYAKEVKTKFPKWVTDHYREYFSAGLPIMYHNELCTNEKWRLKDQGVKLPTVRVLCQPDGCEDLVIVLDTELTDASLTKVTKFELITNLSEPEHGKYSYLQNPEPAFVQWQGESHTFFSSLPMEVKSAILDALSAILSACGDSLAVAYSQGLQDEASLIAVTDFQVAHWLMCFEMETEYFRDEQGPVLHIHRLDTMSQDGAAMSVSH